MPDMPVSSPLSYVGMFLLLAGFFLILAGLKIIRVERITVTPGLKTWGSGLALILLGAVFVLPEIANPFTQYPIPTTALTLSPESFINAPTQAVQPTSEPEPVLETPTIKPTDTLVSIDVLICARSDFDGNRCRVSRTVFPSDTEAVYATWELDNALAQRTMFTRRWHKDGELFLETSNFAGENARWTPINGSSYYVYLSSTEGTGARLWNLASLPAGRYRVELFIDGNLVSVREFDIRSADD